MATGNIAKLLASTNKLIAHVIDKGHFHPNIKGVTVVDMAQDATSMTGQMKVLHEHLNRQGALHGGCSATIIDLVTSAHFMAHQNTQSLALSVQLDVKFFAPALEGDLIEIHSNIIKPGKTLYFLQADLLNKTRDNKLVARGSHIISVSEKKLPDTLDVS